MVSTEAHRDSRSRSPGHRPRHHGVPTRAYASDAQVLMLSWLSLFQTVQYMKAVGHICIWGLPNQMEHHEAPQSGQALRMLQSIPTVHLWAPCPALLCDPWKAVFGALEWGISQGTHTIELHQRGSSAAYTAPFANHIWVRVRRSS